MTTRSIWSVHDVPIAGDPSRLLARQAQIHVPGKVIRGLRLRLELPLVNGAVLPTSVTESIVDEWRAVVLSAYTASSSQGSQDSLECVRRGLTEAGVSWTQIDDRVEWPCSINGRAYRYTGTVCRSWLRIQCEAVAQPWRTISSRSTAGSEAAECRSTTGASRSRQSCGRMTWAIGCLLRSPPCTAPRRCYSGKPRGCGRTRSSPGISHSIV